MRKCLPISVIVPTYNRADYLVETLNAILSQQDQYLELIVVDDFSSDDSRNLLNSFKKKHPEIVLVFLDENLGESNAVNVGWTLATNQYISIINSDDPPHDKWLQEMTTGIECNPGFGFYYPNRLVIDKNGNILRKEALKDWSARILYENLVPIASAGIIINRKDLPTNFEPRDTTVTFPSDLIQMFRLGLLVDGKRVINAWGTWREHSDSISGSVRGTNLAESFKHSVGNWLKQNDDQIKHLSRNNFRDFYLHAHYFLLLRQGLGIIKALKYLERKSIIQIVARDPSIAILGTYLTIKYVIKRLKNTAQILFKSKVLKNQIWE